MPLLPSKPRAERFKFRWDVVLFFGFVAAAMVHATRFPLHEWLGLAVVPMLVVHLWLNWNWILEVMRRGVRKFPREVRFNRGWDVFQFAVASLALASGLLVSRHVLPAIGVPGSRSHFWEDVHAYSANMLVVMIGIHLGLHGHWIWRRMRRARNGEDARARKPSHRRKWTAATVALVLVAGVWVFSHSDLYRRHRSFVVRYRDDFTVVLATMLLPGAVTFAVLAHLQRGRRAV